MRAAVAADAAAARQAAIARMTTCGANAIAGWTKSIRVLDEARAYAKAGTDKTA